MPHKNFARLDTCKLPSKKTKVNSFEDLRLMIIKLVNKGKRDEVLKLLKQFGADKLTDLRDDPAALKMIGFKLREIKRD